ncbi:MAG: tetratricopeptide repeat protein, partial [Anaerolineae bacterium]|nr:tetratricopeptide repeat protein [Anaerolineae bacterium]NIQ81344.1 tetratricopeptide repeat protein [Anaerolineae bacterium]
LSYLYAFALLLSGYSLDAVEARLRDVDTDDDGRGAALRALVAAAQGQLPEAIELSQLALRSLPEDELISRALAMWILSISQTATSDVWTQSRALDEVVRMGQESGSLTVTVAALCYQAALCMRLGQLHKAKAMLEQALGTATTRRGRVLPVAGEALMGLGELHREWNDLEAATRYLEEGIELTRQWRGIAVLSGYISLARVRRAQKDTHGAQRIIQKAMRLARG